MTVRGGGMARKKEKGGIAVRTEDRNESESTDKLKENKVDYIFLLKV